MKSVYTYEFKLLSALYKVFPEEEPQEDFSVPLTALQNETVSFQAAYKIPSPGEGCLRVAVESPISGRVRLRTVELAPSRFPGDPSWNDGNYSHLRPGLFPDILREVGENGVLGGTPGQWRALWVDVEPGGLPAGEYPVCLCFSNPAGEVGCLTATVSVLAARLPEQELMHTEWFHTDCLADYYGLQPWSEEHWEVVGNYVALMVKRGINMVLTPIFTPPLDTEIGGERTTVQLADVYTQPDGGYRFGFDRLRRWFDLCLEKGIKWFEFSHLFTQWGAKAAPKVMATLPDGTQKRIFGWDTPAVGGAYTVFLRAFLPALTAQLNAWGLAGRCRFHISDEPSEEQVEAYRAAKQSIADLLEGFVCMDALSNYEFYARGIVTDPVPSTDHIEHFLENKVENLWTYYCVGQQKDVCNRFFAMPLARCRAIGLQLYKFNIAGFLQWGFNFYNTTGSARHINPYEVTDAGGLLPSGDPFVVYPGPDGVPEESIRLMAMYQALCDLRALKKLEALAGRAHVLALMEDGLEQPITFACYPKEAAYYLSLRERVNREIAARENA